MSRAFIGLGLILGVVVFAAAAVQAENEKFKRLSVDEVAHLVEAKTASIYDNNSRERYQKGHVPSAVWVEPWDMKASDLPADKARALVFYCGNTQCMACHAGAKKALEFGYTNVSIMPAGIKGWEDAGRPTEK